MGKVFYTTKEVAEMLCISTHRVGKLRKQGLLRGTRFGRDYVCTKDDIDDFLRATLGKDLTGFDKMTKEACMKKYLS